MILDNKIDSGRALSPDGLVSGEVVDAAMKVHSSIGPGLLEGAYEACLAQELRARGLHVRTQVPVPLVYLGRQVDLIAYRADLLVDHAVLVELKCVSKLLPVHEAQLLSYLRMGRYRVGLLLNFSALHLRDGIRRKLNNF